MKKNKIHFLNILFLLIFILINIVILTKSPPVWIDEVAYIDPAVNFHLFDKFVSSSWYSMPSDIYWSGNVPGFQFVLILWYEIFGFNITSTRFLPLILLIISSFLIFHALLSSKYFKDCSHILYCVIPFFLFSDIYSYISNQVRPDIFGFFLFSVIFYSLIKIKNNFLIIFFVGILIPFFGLQFIPFFLLFSFIIFLFIGLIFSLYEYKKLIIFVISILIGSFLLLLFYNYLGTLDYFINSINRHTVRDDINFKILSKNILNDKFSLLFVLFSIIIFGNKIKNNSVLKLDYYLIFLILFSKFIYPILISYIGVYPRYYSWMSTSIVFISTLFLYSSSNYIKFKYFFYFIIIANIIIGTPARTILTLYEWNDRNYQNVETFIEKNVIPNKIVFSHWQAYYPLIKNSKKLFLSEESLQKFEKNLIKDIEVLVVPDNYLQSSYLFDVKEWHLVNSLLNKKYNLSIYEKIPQ